MKGPSRRDVIKSLGVLGGLFTAGSVVGQANAPSVLSSVGPLVMKFQSTWPTRDIFHEFAQDFAKKVNEMSGGALRIEVYPTNSIVPAFGEHLLSLCFLVDLLALARPSRFGAKRGLRCRG